MRWNSGLVCVAALLGLTNGDVYQDPDTGFSFSQSSVPLSTGTAAVTMRVAIPSSAVAGQAYDIVLQLVAPISAGWAGVAWGGSMTNNPLLLSWSNSGTGISSIRRATSHTAPAVSTDATVQVLSKGTKSNSTHWQVTAKCTGCASFTTSGSSTKSLNPAGTNRLAFAYSKTKPSQPASASSAITVHDLFSYWEHDFAAGQNAEFEDLIDRNLEEGQQDIPNGDKVVFILSTSNTILATLFADGDVLIVPSLKNLSPI
ncbi:CBD9-like protein [Hypoxylon sp. FL1284]|nr:CBD9-like protein [Hypoxylon sp. FL1284]